MTNAKAIHAHKETLSLKTRGVNLARAFPADKTYVINSVTKATLRIHIWLVFDKLVVVKTL